MFQGFSEKYLEGAGARLFVRMAGPKDGLPVLLLHGYPQTSAMWNGVAPLLAETYRVICPDLRGYGRSGKPESDDSHAAYSKRAMANDLVKIMDQLGYDAFFIGAHDRGARVAHRLGMDHPDRVLAMTLLDIAPTREMYANTSFQFASGYWHWFFLIQRNPLPETIIGQDPAAFWKQKCFNQSGGANPFLPEALDEYLQSFCDAKAIHASCEDYRAAATIDIEHDDADGDRRLSVPLQVFWAKNGTVGKSFDPISLWKTRAQSVEGNPLDATHYMAEEIPAEIADRFNAFFANQTHEDRGVGQ
jgi:haloacetate dehalogenase